MRKLIPLFFVAIGLASGCGKSDSVGKKAVPEVTAETAKESIQSFLAQCGWQDVRLDSVKDLSKPPEGSPENTKAFTFSAEYRNIMGESAKAMNWVAVIDTTGGGRVVSCFDESNRMVAGHRGDEHAVNAANIKAP